jgi:PAS domain S-box-containing protein
MARPKGGAPDSPAAQKSNPELARLAVAARRLQSIAISAPFRRDGGYFLYACAPVARGGQIAGFVGGLYRVADLLESVARGQLPFDFGVSIVVDDLTIHTFRGGPRRQWREAAQIATLTLPTATWEVLVAPSEEDLAGLRQIVLGFGIVASGLLCVSLTLARSSRRRLAEFETLLEVLPIGIAVSPDPQCRNVWVNPALARMVGVSRSENISKTANTAGGRAHKLYRNGKEVPPEALPMQVAARSGNPVLAQDLEIVRSDGRVLHTLSYAAPVFREDGRVRGVLNACIDVTALKHAEVERESLLARERNSRMQAESALAALEQSESTLRCLFDSETIGIVMENSSGILEANDYFLRLCGRKRDELVRSGLRLPELVTTPSLAHLSAQGHIKPAEIEIAHSDGRAVPALAGGAAVENSSGGRRVWFVLDLTERRELERRLRRSEKYRSLVLMAGGIAHDFNNLLTEITGNLSLAMDDLPAGSPGQENLASAMSASHRAADLVGRILAYTGRRHYGAQRIDLSRLITGMRSSLAQLAPPSSSVEFELPADIPLINAGPAEIQEIVRNLMVNAVEALPPSGGRIDIRTGRCVLSRDEIAHRFPDQNLDPGEYVRLTVQDSGCGMLPEMAARIFDPFFSTKFVGRGLGLSSVQGVVHAHGAGIRVQSEPGSGTCFELVFRSCVETDVAAAPGLLRKRA